MEISILQNLWYNRYNRVWDMKREKSLVKENKIVYICDKVIEYGIYSLVFFVPIVFCPYTYDSFELIKMSLLFNITLLILLTWIIKSIENKKIQFNKTPIFWASIIYFIVLVIATLNSKSILISLYGVYGLNQGLFVNLCYVILFIVIINNIDMSKIKNILFFTILSGLLVAIYGVFQYFGYDPVLETNGNIGNRSDSTLGNPVFLGNFLTMILPISIVSSISSSHRWKMFYGFSTAIMFLCLLFTSSRGAWVAFICSLILLIILIVKKIKKDDIKWLLGLFIIIILFIIGFSQKEMILPNKRVTLTERAISSTKLSEPSIVARLNMWRTAIEIIKDYPFLGVGIDAIRTVFLKYQSPQHVKYKELRKVAEKLHNEVLQITSTAGFFGLFAYLFLLVTIVIKVIKLFKNLNDKFLFFTSIGIISGLFAYFVSGQFSFSLITTGILFWIYVGMVDISSKKENQNIKSLNPCSRKRKINKEKINNIFKPVVYIIIFLIAIAGIIIINKPLFADYYFKRGLAILEFDKSNCQDAIYYFKKATQLNPFVLDYHFKLGYCYGELGKRDLAIGEYLKIIEKFKIEEEGIFYNLGFIYQLKGNQDKAIYYFKKSEKIFQVVSSDKIYRVYYSLGLSYAMKSQYNRAIDYFEKSLKTKPNNAEVHLALGRVYYLKGLINESLQHFNKVITLEPNSEIGEEARILIKKVSDLEKIKFIK